MKRRIEKIGINRWCLVVLTFMLTAPFLFTQGCDKGDFEKQTFKTEYQAVLLANGMYYFGKIEKINSRYIELKDVYYVRTFQNPETKQPDNKLFAKSKDLHLPDRMFINANQVILIEPVSPDSKIAQLMKGDKSQAGGAMTK